VFKICEVICSMFSKIKIVEQIFMLTNSNSFKVSFCAVKAKNKKDNNSLTRICKFVWQFTKPFATHLNAALTDLLDVG
jgi:hypothetical protein